MRLINIFIAVLFVTACRETRTIENIDYEPAYQLNAEIQKNIDTDTITNPHFTGYKYQKAASSYAMKGDYRNALKNWDLAMGQLSGRTFSNHEVDSLRSIYRAVPAVDYILEASKAHELVIINEAHHNARHRQFTRSLLQGLYENGYRYLGLETLTSGVDSDSLLSERGYPLQRTGFYTAEPQFGQLVRTALELGYRVFPYEVTGDADGTQREIEQANNILDVLRQDREGKVVIHCGYDHGMEGVHSYWGKAMAGQLSEQSGLDPLTINQVELAESSEPELNDPLLKAFQPTGVTVLLDQYDKPKRYERDSGWMDVVVLQPTTEYLHSRPDWLMAGSDRELVRVELADLEIASPSLVLAYLKAEDFREAVPVDIVEVEPGASEVYLGLDKKQYNIVVVNAQGEGKKFEVEVK